MAYQLLTPSDGDLARCVGVQIASFKNGNQVLLAFKIHGEGPNQGRVTTYFGGLSEDAKGDKGAPIDWTVDALRACGWQGDNLADLPAALERGELGEEVSLKIINEPVLDADRQQVFNEDGSEKWRDKVLFVNIPGEGGAGYKAEQPIEGAELANFGARMRTAVANAGKRKPANGTRASDRQAPRGGGSSGRAAGGRGGARGSTDDRDIPPPSDNDRRW